LAVRVAVVRGCRRDVAVCAWCNRTSCRDCDHDREAKGFERFVKWVEKRRRVLFVPEFLSSWVPASVAMADCPLPCCGITRVCAAALQTLTTPSYLCLTLAPLLRLVMEMRARMCVCVSVFCVPVCWLSRPRLSGGLAACCGADKSARCARRPAGTATVKVPSYSSTSSDERRPVPPAASAATETTTRR
jgi:hypothetical protein